MQTQINALAKTYAKAIFTLASEKNNIDSWQQFLKNASDIVETKEMQNIIVNPAISNNQILQIFLSLFKNISTLENNFLQLLLINNRIQILNLIYNEFLFLSDASKNILDGRIVSAYKLDEIQKKILHATLTKKFHKELRLEFLEDQNLIGGAIIYINNLIFDGSCRNQLLKLSEYINKGNVICN